MNQRLSEKIKKAIDLLMSIQAELSGEATFPEAAKALLASRKCLVCKEPLGDEKIVRGLHERCRKEQKNSKYSEEELIGFGLLAPAATAGRKRSDRLERAVTSALNRKEARGDNDDD